MPSSHEDLQRWIANLAHPDAGVFTRAVRSLAESGEPRAAEALCGVLGGCGGPGGGGEGLFPDYDLRYEQILRRESTLAEVQEALVRLGALAAPSVVCLLRTGNPGARREAAVVLGRMGAPGGAPPLIEAMRLWDNGLFETALQALERIGAGSVPSLCAALQDSNRRVRIGAALALQRIHDLRSVDALCGSLGDEDAYVREMAALALGRIRARRAVGPLCAALRHGNWRAASALGAIRDERALEALCRAAREDDALVSRAAAAALGEMPDPAAIAPLCDALRMHGRRVGQEAAEALSRIAERYPVRELRAAVPLLRRLAAPWSMESEEALRAYQRALGRIDRATDGLRDLPLTATGGPLAGEELPRAAVRPPSDLEAVRCWTVWSAVWRALNRFLRRTGR